MARCGCARGALIRILRDCRCNSTILVSSSLRIAEGSKCVSDIKFRIRTMSSKSQLTYSARASNHPNALAKRLFQIAEAKKTNVTVSADVTTTKELLDLADRT